MPSLRSNSIRAGPTPLRNWALCRNDLEAGGASMGMFQYVVCVPLLARPADALEAASHARGEQAVAHCPCKLSNGPIRLGRSLEQRLSFLGVHAWSGVLQPAVN